MRSGRCAGDQFERNVLAAGQLHRRCSAKLGELFLHPGMEAIVATAIGRERHSDRHHAQRQQRIVIAPAPGDDALGRLVDHRLPEGMLDGDGEGLRGGRRDRNDQQRGGGKEAAEHDLALG